jgi:hypothetical protein
MTAGVTKPVVLVIDLIIGGLLLILALRGFLGEDDSDAPPSKIMVMLEKVGPVPLLGMGFVLSLSQVRYIASQKATSTGNITRFEDTSAFPGQCNCRRLKILDCYAGLTLPFALHPTPRNSLF